MARVRAAREVVAERTENIAVGLRERKKARRRQQIIDTSIKLFRKRGFENTRIDDIVQVLEISQPTFFRYFSSKDGVLREVGERGFACKGTGCARSCLAMRARRNACAGCMSAWQRK